MIKYVLALLLCTATAFGQMWIGQARYTSVNTQQLSKITGSRTNVQQIVDWVDDNWNTNINPSATYLEVSASNSFWSTTNSFVYTSDYTNYTQSTSNRLATADNAISNLGVIVTQNVSVVNMTALPKVSNTLVDVYNYMTNVDKAINNLAPSFCYFGSTAYAQVTTNSGTVLTGSVFQATSDFNAGFANGYVVLPSRGIYRVGASADIRSGYLTFKRDAYTNSIWTNINSSTIGMSTGSATVVSTVGSQFFFYDTDVAGSRIYFTVSAANPSNFWAGTWKASIERIYYTTNNPVGGSLPPAAPGVP